MFLEHILEANPSTSSGVIDAPVAALDAAKVSGPLGAVAGSRGWGVWFGADMMNLKIVGMKV